MYEGVPVAMKSLPHRGINTRNPLAPDEVKALSERECRADERYKDNDTPVQSRFSSRAQLPVGSGPAGNKFVVCSSSERRGRPVPQPQLYYITYIHYFNKISYITFLYLILDSAPELQNLRCWAVKLKFLLILSTRTFCGLLRNP